MSVWTQVECVDGLRTSTRTAQRRGDSRTSTAFMSEEEAQLRTAHSGREVCLFLCSCLSVWPCVWHSRVYVWTCVCECVGACVRSLQQGAVAAAGSASGVFVSELDSSAVVLALPQAGSLDDLLHQLLERTLNTVPGLSTRLWKNSVRGKN